LHHITDRKVVKDVMERLAIASYADRKAGTLSSGNFQRLGLARALFHNPKLLILDEPANALDPAGIVEIRNLLTELAREHGTTVFMSSHILAEVDKLADRIAIIHKGKLVEELDAKRLEEIRVRQLIVETRDLVKTLDALKNYEVIKINEHRLAIKDKHALQAPDKIATLLVNAGTPPLHMSIEQENLEEYFLKLTTH